MFRLILLRVFALLALTVCMAMVVDEFAASPAFCSFRAGCEEITQSVYGRPLGIPLSLIGLISFGGFFTLTLFPSRATDRWIGPLAILAGVAGLALVALQVFVLRRTCPLCLIVDTAAIALAAVELAWPAPTSQEPEPRPLVWAAIGFVMLSLPPAWLAVKPFPQLPPQVEATWSAGRINVVEITDFACPYCRQTHPAIDAFLDSARGDVHFVRIVAPMKHHEHGRAAAKLYFAAAERGDAERAADLLFGTADHSPANLRSLAVELEFDEDEYEAALSNSAFDAQLDETLAWASQLPGGLPQIGIDEIPLVGLQSQPSLHAAFKRVKRQKIRQSLALVCFGTRSGI